MPATGAPNRPPCLLREAQAADLDAVAALCRDLARPPWSAAMIAPEPDRTVLVATVGGELVGVAKTHWYPEADNAAPGGHYLGGVLVARRWRRRGIGTMLTTTRLDWIWNRSATAFYVTNEHNAASIALHEALGFEVIAKAPAFHGVVADGPARLLLFSAERR